MQTYLLKDLHLEVVVTCLEKNYVLFQANDILATDETGEIISSKHYLHCAIHKNSVSEFWFGDPDCEDLPSISFHGAKDYIRHIKLIVWLYEEAFKLMKHEPPDRWEFATSALLKPPSVNKAIGRESNV